ncbi:MAG: DNA polymerase III subunit delta [Candidatus Tectomicrobia bacterium]|uniref:DNA polymerase III subunit delta n=1 Tax=Tectimicrobiota bacterium TaxID=2528274 RepID=A0A932FY60_UNCTE|nr:DNA polymerase III subunit delta [Candidatus Tectomicrobia bacterium]
MQKLDYRGLLKEIEGGRIAPLYLFYGEERRFQEEAIQQILSRTIEPAKRALNIHTFYGKETTALSLLDAANAPPFSASRRLVILKESELLASAEQERLTPYCQRPLATTCLIFLTQKATSLASKLSQAISTHGRAVEFSPLPPGEVLNWMIRQAREWGYRLSPSAAKYLQEVVGNELTRIHQELEKAVSFVGERRTIELADLQEICPPQLQASVFQLVEALGERRLAQALSCLHSLSQQNEPPLVILSLIGRHFRQLWQVQSLREKGCSKSQMAQEMGMPAFRVEKLLTQARPFSSRALREIWTDLLETDIALKSSPLQEKLVLEGLLLRLCQKSQ